MAARRSTASVATSSGRRYMVQLCNHFAHRVPASFDEDSGALEFPFGVCALKVGQDALDLSVEARTAEDLERMEQVIQSHLARFAFREPLEIAWVRN
jgi:hypothetical protein